MKDTRLDLNRYVRNPFDGRGKINRQLDFGELFRSKAPVGEYPWNNDRFQTEDLIKKAMSRKKTTNPRLNFVSNSPWFRENADSETGEPNVQLFEGLGRFRKASDYDFNDGKPMTRQRPQDQPDFSERWVQLYELSPTLNPGDAVKNIMPSASNPDPRGYLMGQAEKRVEREAEGDKSVKELLEEGGGSVSEKPKEVKAEEKQGEKTEEEKENQPPEISPDKIV